MRAKWLAFGLIVLVCAAWVPMAAQDQRPVPAPPATAASKPAAEPAGKRPMELGDILAWKAMGPSVLSNDGAWYAYRLQPLEGDSELVVRATASDKTHRFPIGETRGGPGGGPQAAAMAAAAAAPTQFSHDGKWLAFTVYPTRAESARLRRTRRAPQNKLRLLDLTTGKDVTIENVRRFAFAGERGGWLAIQKSPPDTPGGGGPAAAAAGAGAPTGGPSPAGSGGGAAADRPKGTDLILRDLTTGRDLNIGNVSEFTFNKAGTVLALVIDAADKAGNGVHLRAMATGAVTVLDSDKANYERLAWTEKGDALAVLKTAEDKAFQDKLYAVLGFMGLEAGAASTVVFDPKAEKAFPADMSVSPDRTPGWTDDLANLTFGIRKVRKKPADEKPAGPPAAAAGAPDADRADDPAADEKPDLVLWHHKDPRLQSQQEVEEDRDKRFAYLCLYRVADKAFVRLADDDMRDVTLPQSGTWAVGFDDDDYEFQGSTEGRRFRDVYAVDMKTGAKTIAVKKARWAYGQSPDGARMLYYNDGHYFTYDFAAGTAANITLGAPVSFVDVENDQNIVKPPVPPLGWDKTGQFALLSDGWDVWKVPVAGGAAVNLTGNGRKDAIRYQQRLRLDPDEKGADLSVPQYFMTYGEWTKKGGIAKVSPGASGAESLVWDAAVFSRVAKAEKAGVVVYARESFTEAPEVFVSDGTFKPGLKLTDNGAQQKAFAWSSGAMLVDYKSDKGAKLQGALFLPANYEKGKKYPTIVYIYETLSQGLNRFTNPTANGFNATAYTSNGYAVLMPDITYTINDPGMSAVWCVLPALKAAIATGVVDPAKVGLQGHSWGGYQTSFLVTQTKSFAAAVAGAPLTNMISMYSLIYKNSGGGNMAIFESSQGRFRGGYWGENWNAYYRNSPVFFAQNVTTPLVILHNDKDGAVDFTQGVEYYNTLRRMGKTVVMLEYVGENHGLAKPANQQDYTVRMKEFFDHHLKGTAAPAWYTNGVPRLDMADHLKERAGMGKKKDAPEKAEKPGEKK